MSFAGLGVAQATALFGAVALPIVALYLLKLRRRRVEVPFARLWSSALAERTPTSWLRRLRRLWSLLLQLALVALVVLALSDPQSAAGARGARSVVIAIDCSASMQARDVAPSRMARARAEALRLVAGLGAADRALVLRLDAEPAPVTGWEHDVGALDRAIDGLDASDAPADLAGAVALARDALAGRPGPQLVIVSDGQLRDEMPPMPGVDVRFLRIGRAGENVGITAIGVRRYPANRSSYEVLVEVTSHASGPSRRTLTLESDGETVETAVLELVPGETTRRVYPNLSGAQRRLRARLEPGDAFALDDVAYALLPPRKKRRVLVVTDGNLFLEGALLLDENLDVDRVAPTALGTAEVARHDVVVYDRIVPKAPPPSPALYVAPPAAESPIAVRAETARPLLTETAAKHPLLRWIELGDVNIAHAEVFALERGDVALAGGMHEPIIVAGERAGRRLVVVGFDVRRSDLPMRVAFPVFVAQAIDWLAGEEPDEATTLRTGRPWRIPGPRGGELVLEDPRGQRASAPVFDDGRAAFFGQRAGFHRVLTADGAPYAELAANLADRAESEISPRPLQIGQWVAPPPDFGRGSGPRGQPWRMIALVAFALTLVEWWSYQRRWTA